MESLVETVLEGTAGSRVCVVRVEIGELAGVDVEALRFSFDVCCAGTLLAGSMLDVVRIPGRARCRRCGLEERTRSLAAACACGSYDRALTAGDELRLAHV